MDEIPGLGQCSRANSGRYIPLHKPNIALLARVHCEYLKLGYFEDAPRAKGTNSRPVELQMRELKICTMQELLEILQEMVT